MALHGHTKIELTDVNTGEVEVVEEDNIITKGVQRILELPARILQKAITDSPAYGTYNDAYNNCIWSNQNWSNIKYLMRGVALFSNTFDENEENYNLAFTKFDKLVGRAGDYTSTAEQLGSYNSAESKFDIPNKQIRYVWDFGTSQANGKINSVCLVPSGCATTTKEPYWSNQVLADGARITPYSYIKFSETIADLFNLDSKDPKLPILKNVFYGYPYFGLMMCPYSSSDYMCFLPGVTYVSANSLAVYTNAAFPVVRLTRKANSDNGVGIVCKDLGISNTALLSSVFNIESHFIDMTPINPYFIQSNSETSTKLFDSIMFAYCDTENHFLYYTLSKQSHGTITNDTKIYLFRISTDTFEIDTSFGTDGVNIFDIALILPKDVKLIHSHSGNYLTQTLNILRIKGSKMWLAVRGSDNNSYVVYQNLNNKLDNMLAYPDGIPLSQASFYIARFNTSQSFEDRSDCFCELKNFEDIETKNFISCHNSFFYTNVYQNYYGELLIQFDDITNEADVRYKLNTTNSSSIIPEYVMRNYETQISQHFRPVFSKFYKNGLRVSTSFIGKTYNASDYVQGTIHIGAHTPFLLSINNLSTPVNKTNSQTMKVTYTITEDES